MSQDDTQRDVGTKGMSHMDPLKQNKVFAYLFQKCKQNVLIPGRNGRLACFSLPSGREESPQLEPF